MGGLSLQAGPVLQQVQCVQALRSLAQTPSGGAKIMLLDDLARRLLPGNILQLDPRAHSLEQWYPTRRLLDSLAPLVCLFSPAFFFFV